MGKTNPWKNMIRLGGLIIIVSVIDAFKAPISAVPFIGPVITTISNTILEGIQAVIGGYMVYLGVKK